MTWRHVTGGLLFLAGLVAGVEPGVLACAADSSAAAVPTTAQIPDAGEENSSYCGIYCVYAALNGFGKKMEFADLISTRYVGTMYGSSIHELAAAVEDHGLHSLPMMGLSRANLVSAQSPIVLHVSRPDSPGHFNHWVLFMGMEDGKAKVLDAPHRPELMPVADILASWDGVGLYVSEQPLAPWRLKVESLLTGENLALFAGLIMMSAILQRLLAGSRRDLRVARPMWMAVPILLIAAGILSAGWHVLSEDGYVRNQLAVRTVIQEHRPSFLPKLEVPALERAMKDEKVVVIDARYPRDFEAGHLPGAINVPVFTTQTERRTLLQSVPRDARVIVYCQSEGCKFDETLGSALVAEGIENVSLFPGGWMQWKQSMKTDQGKPEAKE